MYIHIKIKDIPITRTIDDLSQHVFAFMSSYKLKSVHSVIYADFLFFLSSICRLKCLRGGIHRLICSSKFNLLVRNIHKIYKKNIANGRLHTNGYGM